LFEIRHLLVFSEPVSRLMQWLKWIAQAVEVERYFKQISKWARAHLRRFTPAAGALVFCQIARVQTPACADN
jgi:hypothetical protein